MAEYQHIVFKEWLPIIIGSSHPCVLKLFNDFDGVAWHWYPLGAGSGDGVIPNVNDPKFLKDKIIPRLDEVELYYRSGSNTLA